MSGDLILALDTATSATVVGLAGPGLDPPLERRDDPEPGQRPRHAQQLLPLAQAALDEVGATFADIGRVVAGTGPGSFTGLRIGLATARALALAADAELVGVSTLQVLAAAAAPERDGIIAPVLDARRGEVFVAAWAGEREAVTPRALKPDAVAELDPRGWLGVGDGAVRFRSILEQAGMSVPADDSPLHRVSATVLVRLGAQAPAGPRTAVLPDYQRLPDAELSWRARTQG